MKCHSSYSYETFSMLCFFPILFLFIFLFTSSAKRGRWMRMLRDQKHTDTIVFVEKNLNILPMESSLKLHDLHSVRRIWSARVRVDWCCATWHFWYYFFVHSSEKSHRAKQSSPVASSHIFFALLCSPSNHRIWLRRFRSRYAIREHIPSYRNFEWTRVKSTEHTPFAVRYAAPTSGHFSY